MSAQLGFGLSSNALYLSTSNVGIGKSNPSAALDVVGSINFTGTLRSNNTPLSFNVPADITVDNVDAKASATLSVGGNAATTTLNLGTNGSTQAINMGTGSGVKTITIGGGTDDTVSINGNLTVAGTTVTVNSTNANILDKIITLNKGGAAASGALVGLEIEEAGSAAGGYLRTNATRDAWVAKAPNGSEVTIGGTSSQFQTSGSIVYLPSGSNLAIGKSNAAYALDVVGEINASSNIRINGQSLQGLGVPNKVILTSGTSNWTPPAGVTSCQIQIVGGGGSGGCSENIAYSSGNPATAGGGGGSGGYIECVLTGLNSTYTTLSLSVGSGGTGVSAGNAGNAGTATTITAGSGATTLSLSAGGGGGGTRGSTSADTGGAPGTNAVTIPLTVQSYYQVSGSTGGGGQFINTGGSSIGGNGGPSYFGGGGKGAFYSNTTSGTAYGSGGGGCGTPASGSSGAGAQGIIIITYFTQSGLPTNYTASAPLSMSGTTLSIANATTSAPGVVQPDNITTVMSSGVLAATAPFRNRLINGNMLIDQRNTGSAVTSANGYTVDRWQVSPAVISVNAQQVTTPATLSGFPKALKMTNTSTSSFSGGSGYWGAIQLIEGLNMYDFMWGTPSALPITVSLYVYSSATGTFNIAVKNNAGTRAYATNATIATANTWQYVSVTIPGDTSAGSWDTGTTASALQLTLCFGLGSSYQMTANSWLNSSNFGTSACTNFAASTNTIYFTGVQLEKGSIATPFEYRPYPIEYQLCQRYYEKIGGLVYMTPNGAGATGWCYSTPLIFAAPKRTYPTMTYIDSSRSGIGSTMVANTPQAGLTNFILADNSGNYYGWIIGITYSASAEL